MVCVLGKRPLREMEMERRTECAEGGVQEGQKPLLRCMFVPPPHNSELRTENSRGLANEDRCIIGH